MIELFTLPKIVYKRAKRRGRGLGSGRGAKSGRGITRHQKARETIPLSFEGGQNRLIKKFPLLRGKGKNKSRQAKTLLIPLRQLQKLPAESEVTLELLRRHHLISEKSQKIGVKIAGDGKIEKKLIIKLPITKKARALIEKAGGQVITA